MLAFPYRFHGQRSLRYVLAKGDSCHGQYVKVKYCRTGRRGPRFAVVVSKKVYKGAVGRNRIRRRLYEAIRHELPHFGGPCDVVVLVFSSEILSLSSPEVRAVVRGQLGEAGLYN